jgi:hypothetical protein
MPCGLRLCRISRRALAHGLISLNRGGSISPWKTPCASSVPPRHPQPSSQVAARTALETCQATRFVGMRTTLAALPGQIRRRPPRLRGRNPCRIGSRPHSQLMDRDRRPKLVATALAKPDEHLDTRHRQLGRVGSHNCGWTIGEITPLNTVIETGSVKCEAACKLKPATTVRSASWERR